MTTIATDGKSLAADSRASCNGIVSSDTMVKVARLPDGRVVGMAGGIAKCQIAVQALSEQRDLSDMDWEDVHLVIADGSPFLHVYECSPLPLILPAPYAVGSGRELAIGAMDAGKSPKEAVQLAIKRDIYSGGTVRCLAARRSS